MKKNTREEERRVMKEKYETSIFHSQFFIYIYENKMKVIYGVRRKQASIGLNNGTGTDVQMEEEYTGRKSTFQKEL